MVKKLKDKIITSDFAECVLDRVSQVYDEDLYNLIVFNSIGHEMDIIFRSLDRIDKKAFPQHAPAWILELWAELYGVRTKGRARWLDLISYKLTWEEASNYTWEELLFYVGSLEDIRKRILAKIRATSPITKSNFSDYIEDLTGYRVELTHFPEDYYVTIHMKKGQGGAILVEDLAEIVEETIPAHVGFFISTENIRWIEFNSLNWTFQDLNDNNVTWEDFEKSEVWLEWLEKAKS